MSAPSDISSTGAEAKVLNEIELAVRTGAARALRTRASIQLQKAAEGTSSAGEKYAGIAIRSPEAAMAANLAATFEMIANEIEERAVR